MCTLLVKLTATLTIMKMKSIHRSTAWILMVWLVGWLAGWVDVSVICSMFSIYLYACTFRFKWIYLMPRGLHILTIASFARNIPKIQCKNCSKKKHRSNILKCVLNSQHNINTYVVHPHTKFKSIYQCSRFAFTFTCASALFFSTQTLSLLLTYIHTHLCSSYSLFFVVFISITFIVFSLY